MTGNSHCIDGGIEFLLPPFARHRQVQAELVAQKRAINLRIERELSCLVGTGPTPELSLPSSLILNV